MSMTDVLPFGLRRNDLPEYRRFAAGVGLRVMGVIASGESVCEAMNNYECGQ